VDQTRGWFYTLHAIATLTQDSVAYKAVVSNGLVLDKVGQKMSKRLGNAADPFKTLDQFGADAVRWYMISNASPWDNLKFDAEGITEVQRKFFRALFNTYNFFALYANIDGFDSPSLREKGPGDQVALTEMDHWVLSRLNSLIKQCDVAFGDYEPTIAARAIQDFVVEDLSNWYVRLNRRRFWKGEQGADKNAAFQTLYRCLEIVSKLSAPIAPFFSDRLHRDLSGASVHLSDWPKHSEAAIDVELEQRTALAQKLTSLVLSIRKKEGHRVRQPLQKMMVPVTDAVMRTRLEAIRELVLGEVNVKELVILDASESKLNKKIKPDFKKLGARMGKLMKNVAAAVNGFSQAQIAELEANGTMRLSLEGQDVELLRDDVEITAENVPGLSVASDGALTVALDITMNEALVHEGIARELVSRIQTLRKESGFEVTDRIDLRIQRNGDASFESAVKAHAPHILAETLALTSEDQLLVADLAGAPGTVHQVELDERLTCALALSKRAN
jgi:isoleucyl-tRNA synthetase